ncbi:PTS sugar transporter subunit IIB [Klebsiella oxytoca]|uniref:PTS sugar transporter subunit IIB n=1 Tax=Klebsiella oxytoca TaxID=571 RepID=UPI003969F25B
MKNIVLCCAAGMSTSMLVQRMQAAAQQKGYAVPQVCPPACWFNVCRLLRNKKVWKSPSKPYRLPSLKITLPLPILSCSAPR